MIVDLTHALNEKTKEYPGDPKYQQSPAASIKQKGFSVHALLLNSHLGTHLDAPCHVLEAGLGVSSIPLEKVYGPAYCLPLGENGPLDYQQPITLSMLLPYGKLFCPGAKILIYTGWGQFFGTKEYFQKPPFLSDGAVDYIAGRKIDLLGLDLPSPGNKEIDIAAHKELLRSKIVLVENLVNLERLPPPPQTFCLCAAPLPIDKMDGIPIRAFAVVP